MQPIGEPILQWNLYGIITCLFLGPYAGIKGKKQLDCGVSGCEKAVERTEELRPAVV